MSANIIGMNKVPSLKAFSESYFVKVYNRSGEISITHSQIQLKKITESAFKFAFRFEFV